MTETGTTKSVTSYRTCPLCEATCGLAIEHDGNRVLRVRGDREDVLSRGYLCPKGVALGALHDDPDRLREPLIRVDGRLRPTSWEEAFARVAAGLAPHLDAPRRNAIGAYVGNPTVHNLGGALFLRPLLKALGTRQIFTAATVDQIPKNLVSGLLFGDPAALPVPDIDRCDYLLLLGANPWESNGSLWTVPDLPRRMRALRRRGGRFVVVDPRRTRTAAHADEHLAIRPGRDALWLLALAQVISSEGLARPGALADLTPQLTGIGALLAPFTPEAVAAHCDIPAPVTRRIARELAAVTRGAVYARIGTHANRFGTLAAWTTELLNILTGNLDREGGVMFPLAAHERAHAGGAQQGFRSGRWRSRVSGHPEVMGEIPAAALAEEIETPGDGQIRALVTIAGNPVLSTPNGARLARALETLEFMVSVDIYLNETTRHADVILPPPSPLERSHYDYFFLRFAVRNVANYSPPLLDGSQPDESEILLRLAAIASGPGAASDPGAIEEDNLRELIAREIANPDSSIAGCSVDEIRARVDGGSACDRVVDFLLRTGPYGDGFTSDRQGLSLQRLREHPHGLDFGPLRPRLREVLRTASGVIELRAETIEREIEQARATLARPAPDHQQQMLLIGRREVRSNNSWLHNLAPLGGGKRCTLRMHAADAARLGLRDGALVRIASATGEVCAPLEIHAEMRPGVVSLPHGYGHRYADTRQAHANAQAGVSMNDLVTGAIDGPSGNAVLNAIEVELSAA